MASVASAVVVVAGCGPEAAEPLAEEEATAAVGSESVEEVVEEDQRATVGFLGLAEGPQGAHRPSRCRRSRDPDRQPRRRQRHGTRWMPITQDGVRLSVSITEHFSTLTTFWLRFGASGMTYDN